MKKLTLKEFKERSESIHGYLYEYSEYNGMHKEINIYCKKCKKYFKQTPNVHMIKKCGCPNCSKLEKITFKKLKENGEKIHVDINGIPLYEYKNVNNINSRSENKIFCKNCKEFFIQTYNVHIIKKCGCPHCFRINFKKFKEISEKIHIDENNNRLYKYFKKYYENSLLPTKIFCNNCQKIFTQIPQSHIQGHGCKKCADKKKGLTFKEFKERSEKIHIDENNNTLYEYKDNIYINFKKHISIYCKKCEKEFTQIPESHLNGSGCPICNGKKSKGEIKISLLLKEKNVYFHRNYIFKDCKNIRQLPFDFYLPKHNICIEFDGKQHFESIKWFGGEESLKNYKLRDKIKTEYCTKNKIKLIRIRYNENIYEKLKEIR